MKNNFFKKYYKLIFGVIVGALLTSPVVFAYCLWAENVGFTSSTGLSSTNVQDAIEELSKKQKECPSEPEETIPEGTVCIRAKSLHSSQCQNQYCSENGDIGTIEWGNLGTKGAALQHGDALDCDVNGDGTYDPQKERFYYVNDLSTDSSYAVLVFFNNSFYSGDQYIVESPSGPPMAYDSRAPYYSSIYDFSGPTVAIQQLPSTTTWSNVHLSNTNRSIVKEVNSNSRIDFNYEGKAARLISVDDIRYCMTSNFIDSTNNIKLSHECNFLMENTKYAGSAHSSYWTENGAYGYLKPVSVSGSLSLIATETTSGVRPVIEVKKSDIYY